MHKIMQEASARINLRNQFSKIHLQHFNHLLISKHNDVALH